MSAASDESLRIAVSAMTRTLREIATRRDCDYLDCEADRPSPCDCPRCLAVDALKLAGEWRYVGALHERVTTHAQYNPREVKLHRAWSGRADDRLLAQILTSSRRDDRPLEMPSARDWYVATSVVQWLATNVGSGVLEEAGFRYQGYEEDRESREAAKDGRSVAAPAPASPGDPKVADVAPTRGRVAEARIQRAIRDAAEVILGAISGHPVLPARAREVATELGARVVRACVARLEGR